MYAVLGVMAQYQGRRWKYAKRDFAASGVVIGTLYQPHFRKGGGFRLVLEFEGRLYQQKDAMACVADRYRSHVLATCHRVVRTRCNACSDVKIAAREGSWVTFGDLLPESIKMLGRGYRPDEVYAWIADRCRGSSMEDLVRRGIVHYWELQAVQTRAYDPQHATLGVALDETLRQSMATLSAFRVQYV